MTQRKPKLTGRRDTDAPLQSHPLPGPAMRITAIQNGEVGREFEIWNARAEFRKNRRRKSGGQSEVGSRSRLAWGNAPLGIRGRAPIYFGAEALARYVITQLDSGSLLNEIWNKFLFNPFTFCCNRRN